jgi:hypothetical protein
LLTEIPSKPGFKDCNIERTVIGDNSQYNEHNIDNSKHIERIDIGDNSQYYENYINNSQNIYSENYSKYEGRKENDNIFWNIFTAFIEKLAPLFISRFDESKTILLGFSVAILGFLISSSPFLFFSDNNLSIIPDDAGYKLEFTFLFGYFLVIIAALILSIVLIGNHTKCKKCNKDFGYKEVKRPLIEETRCSDGIRKKTTRYYKCQYCGDEKNVPMERTIKYKDLLK